MVWSVLLQVCSLDKLHLNYCVVVKDIDSSAYFRLVDLWA